MRFPFNQQQVDKFRELYLSEQEEKLNLKAELKDCQVMLKKKFMNHAYCFFFC